MQKVQFVFKNGGFSLEPRFHLVASAFATFARILKLRPQMARFVLISIALAFVL